MPYRTLLVAVVATVAHATAAAAQTYAVASDLLFYGDNTEFSNPFRSGETILGTSGRIFLDVTWNDRVTLRGGLFGLGRYGSHEFLEHAEPAIALEVAHGPSKFIFGSLDTVAWHPDVDGPDLETPHRLLPPIQRETLTFTRGQEMGLQWLVGSTRITHDAWIEWQRLNTPEFRERFDAGYRADIGLSSAVRLHGQWHIVHEGGQQFDHGAVRDSQAGAAGLQWSTEVAMSRVEVEGYVVATQHVPDRDQPQLNEAGLGVFTRAAATRGSWRAHLIVWRGRDTLKEEGDRNYLASRLDGSMFRKVRDYAEFGLTRQFRPAPGVHMFAAVRMHRTESNYEYSYHIVARVHLRRAL
jgi:hypothetical protein